MHRQWPIIVISLYGLLRFGVVIWALNIRLDLAASGYMDPQSYAYTASPFLRILEVAQEIVWLVATIRMFFLRTNAIWFYAVGLAIFAVRSIYAYATINMVNIDVSVALVPFIIAYAITLRVKGFLN